MFLRRTALFAVLTFLAAEVICRVKVDRAYFQSIDTYRVFPAEFPAANVAANDRHIDYLFIGSSRVPASINPDVIQRRSPGTTAVVAGRGYTTGGLHYQALKKKVQRDPGYLKGTSVIIEYGAIPTYFEPFSDTEYHAYETMGPDGTAMPHLMLPHLDRSSFFGFLKHSRNSWRVKIDMTLLYASSFYRTAPYVRERIRRYDAPSKKSADRQLATDGGIRNDRIELAKQLALSFAREEKAAAKTRKPLTESALDRSMLGAINKVVRSNGGTLMLYKMPMHSIHQDLTAIEEVKRDRKTFGKWLHQHEIAVLAGEGFTYSDADFPDIWHLGADRRDEFSSRLYDEILAMQSRGVLPGAGE